MFNLPQLSVTHSNNQNMQNSASLVKYNTPTLVNTTGAKGKKGTKKAVSERQTTQTEDILNSILPPRFFLVIIFEMSLSLTYSLREWTEDGQLWVQYVSSTPATRLDIVNLQEHLDHQLQVIIDCLKCCFSSKSYFNVVQLSTIKARQARETGICPVREELYAQCFGILKI